MSARVWKFVAPAVLLAVVGVVVAGNVRDAAREVRSAAEATERAGEIVERLDSLDPDSVRARAQAIGGALGAGLRAIVDSARATPDSAVPSQPPTQAEAGHE